MSTLDGLIAGLTLINSKGNNGKFVSAEHDEIYSGDIDDFTPEEIKQMEEWGWYPSEFESFLFFA